MPTSPWSRSARCRHKKAPRWRAGPESCVAGNPLRRGDGRSLERRDLEGAATLALPHAWHLEQLDRLCAADPGLLRPTNRLWVDLEDADSVAAATAWWEAITAGSSEGMVVKPADTLPAGRKGPVQPAVKCRGREYLRIIYGPEYDLPENLERLRQRGLSGKRSLAMREFCLGLEALTRFVNNQPLRLVHECVFGVLALESEPVDPRL